MGLSFKKSIRAGKKAIFIFFSVTVVFLAVIFHNWVWTQLKHTVSFYYVWQGDLKYKQGKLQEAINEYNHALKLFPEHVKARYNLGNIYVTYEDFNSAATCYELALKANPDYINARINLGIILAESMFNFDAAINEYIKAINVKPIIINIPFIFNNGPAVKTQKAIAYYNLGLAYKGKSLLYPSDTIASRNYLEKSVESYRKSLKYDSDNYETRYNLALTLHILGNHIQALEEYCKAINIEPLNYEAHYNLALLLRERLKYKESIQELEKAGLLLDAKGESFKTRYIYMVLNDVSQRSVLQKANKYQYLSENLDEEPSKSDDITYLNGKVVITENLEKAILDNMKTCDGCKVVESLK